MVFSQNCSKDKKHKQRQKKTPTSLTFSPGTEGGMSHLLQKPDEGSKVSTTVDNIFLKQRQLSRASDELLYINMYIQRCITETSLFFPIAPHHSESSSSSSSSSPGDNVGSSDVRDFLPLAVLLLRCRSRTVRMRMSMVSKVASSSGVEENHSGLLGTQERSGRR